MTTKEPFDIDDRYVQSKKDIYYSLLAFQCAVPDGLSGAPKYFVYTKLKDQYIFGVAKFCGLKNITKETYKQVAYHQTQGGRTQRAISRILGDWIPYAKIDKKIQNAFEKWISSHITYNYLENAAFLPVFLDETDMSDLIDSSIDSIKSNKAKISKEDFDYLLSLKKSIGDAGEEIAYQYEVNRLEQKGTVQRTYLENIAAGYDLYSEHESKERFIEVKSSLSSHPDEIKFYLSENGSKVLEEKGENGFIYFVNITEGHIYEIQNPIKKIKENGSKKEINTYQITLKK